MLIINGIEFNEQGGMDRIEGHITRKAWMAHGEWDAAWGASPVTEAMQGRRRRERPITALVEAPAEIPTYAGAARLEYGPIIRLDMEALEAGKHSPLYTVGTRQAPGVPIGWSFDPATEEVAGYWLDGYDDEAMRARMQDVERHVVLGQLYGEVPIWGNRHGCLCMVLASTPDDQGIPADTLEWRRWLPAMSDDELVGAIRSAHEDGDALELDWMLAMVEHPDLRASLERQYRPYLNTMDARIKMCLDLPRFEYHAISDEDDGLVAFVPMSSEAPELYGYPEIEGGADDDTVAAMPWPEVILRVAAELRDAFDRFGDDLPDEDDPDCGGTTEWDDNRMQSFFGELDTLEERDELTELIEEAQAKVDHYMGGLYTITQPGYGFSTPSWYETVEI